MLLGAITLVSVAVAAVISLHSGAFESMAWLWVLPLGLIGSFLALVVLAFVFLWVLCNIVDKSKPQGKDSKFYRGMMHLYIDAIITVARVKITASGLEKTPKEGRFLLVCNHLDNVDPAFLLTCFRKSQLAFITKKEVGNMFLVGQLTHKILCQPINRENDREALKTILNCIKLIREDEVSIAVFPEGWVSLDQKLHHFRPGVFKIAQKTKVPVVVCTLRNTPTVVPSFVRLKPSHVEVRLLEVISPQQYEGLTTVELAARVHRIMANDLGPENVLEG